ncbi:MAG: hypothetical protein ACM35G_04930 [Planctomycetaceae bacterium]
MAIVPFYRYWNSGVGDHFYTTNWWDLAYGRWGWEFEGTECRVHDSPESGTAPLYRYWNPGVGDHFYTTDWNALGTGKYGWSLEKIECYVYPA